MTQRKKQQTMKASDHHERLSAVEVSQQHLDNRVEQLARDVSEGFASLRRAIEQQRQPVTAFAGWASVILALVYAFGSPLNEKDQRHQYRIDAITEQIVAAAVQTAKVESAINRLDGDIAELKVGISDNDMKSQERHGIAIQRIENLDIALQREMRDLDAIGEERDKSLDDVLQREMRMVTEIAELRGSAFDQRIEALTQAMKEKLEDLSKRMISTESTRFTASNGEEFRKQLDALSQEVAKTGATINQPKD